MGAVLQLASARTVTREEVERAWATLRALNMAECNDPSLANDEPHQAAASEARDRFRKLYLDWCGQ